ncbi:adenosylcobalamin-dependent ribonucleoside-diphosphate reductase [Brevibacillus laterosporus]|uniref:adenosylcobalamin-dependent ribonucleoside-diphosphate reductase n=1 Tax=Brevibacillus laterosporus TaxID=1465 RepID=UPI000CE4D011|nr:adenosylcobalamin-dependent ribonucleoside-diphosphate reductase [Brevibacillus laterosporus]PPA87673.1 adenosylcobalamin-dependent ribonucleoside-diphosphate reductase [Brevibacillus laterosporus]
MYKFEYEAMEFSKDGQLDELIALDRYAISTYDNFQLGNTVVAIVDKNLETKKIATITRKVDEDKFIISDRHSTMYTVNKELLQKPLELKPSHMWERWAKGASSVENEDEKKKFWENEFRWLFDGYRYSLGGRIQLMLGQEYVTGKKANLTAYNCYVARSPKSFDNPKEQFTDVLEVAYKEASIMRRGGGVGINISTIKTVKGSGATLDNFIFYLDENHADYEELQDRIKLGKFKGVQLVTSKNDFQRLPKEVKVFKAIDSVDNGLFDNLKQMVQESYSGFKVAIDFNDLRHRKAIVKGVNGRSSGAVSWMELFVLVAQLLQKEEIDNVEFAEIFSFVVGLIEQGGSRRGALMLINKNDNSSIYKFIERKKVSGYLAGANISVAIDDDFMLKVKDAKKAIEKNFKPYKECEEALNLWNLIIKSAWESAEPGVVWLERYNKESNTWYFHEIICTNPCGEQGLPEWGVCNLGHFVLPRFYNKQANDINWEELKRAIRAAVRLQDNIIDYTPYFLEENKQTQLKERRVGIGSLGLGTLLIHKKLRYGSEEANKFIEKLYKFIAIETYKTSIDLAIEKGKFPAFNAKYISQSGFMKRLLQELPKEYQEKFQKYGIRNATLLTQAPTGSTGTYIDNIPMMRELCGGTTTGIEPYFSWEYWRAGRLGVTKQTVDLAKEYLSKNGLTDVKQLPDYFVTAMDLLPTDHVKVQAAIQKWTDSSISKTANCPNDFTIEQTDELYMLAYDLGLKGMTIYRDGSRMAQVLATKEEDAKLEMHIEAKQLEEIKASETNEQEQKGNVLIKKRPKRLYGFTEKAIFSYGDKMGKAYVTINLDEGTPVEVFIQTKEKEISSMAKALGLMTTKLLRLGGTNDNLEQAIKTLTYDQTMGTLPFAVANILKGVQKERLSETSKGKSGVKLQRCPDCKESSYDKGNCICYSCGASKCN